MILSSGTIELRSGVWQWQLLGGERVRFIHFMMEGTPDNQMLRPLVSDATVDDASARRFASHPGTRVWIAPDGERWLVHDLSYLARVRHGGPRELTMIRADGEDLSIQVSDSLELGQMTDEELLELMWRAQSQARAEAQAQADAKSPAKPRTMPVPDEGVDDEAADRSGAAESPGSDTASRDDAEDDEREG